MGICGTDGAENTDLGRADAARGARMRSGACRHCRYIPHSRAPNQLSLPFSGAERELLAVAAFIIPAIESNPRM